MERESYDKELLYDRFITETTQDHNWIIERVCQTTNYRTNNEQSSITMRNAIVDAIDELKKKKTLMCIYTLDEIYKLAENLFNNNREKYTEYYYNRKINTQYCSNANQHPVLLKC